MASDIDLQQALGGHIRYFRDLGIFDLYRRRGVAVEVDEPVRALSLAPESIDAPFVTATVAHSLPKGEGLSEAPLEMPRVAPVLPLAMPERPIAPQLRAGALHAIREEIGDCTRCPLSLTRNKIVFGDGNPNARLLFVGEGPGADEDAQGIPFVGRGGQLLNNMIQAMGLTREEVYIANIVKCRPPQNRVPEPIEANTCTPFLLQQIGVIRPQLIVALGATAATYLLGRKSPLSALRGRFHEALGTKLIITYHPAYLLRDPAQKKEAWKDLQMAMAELGLKARRAGS